MIQKLQFILSMAIFGTIGLFVRYIPLPSSDIASMTSGIGFIFLLTIFILKKTPRTPLATIKAHLGKLLLACLGLAGNWLFLYASYQHTSITNATLAYYLAPILLVVYALIVDKEALSAKKALAIVAALVGFVLLLTQEGVHLSPSDAYGMTLGFIAAVFYAGLMIVNRHITAIPKLELTIIQLAGTCLLLQFYVKVYCGHTALPHLSLSAWGALLVLGIVNVGLGFWLFFSGMEGLSSQTIATLSYIDPLVAIGISTIFLNEGLGLKQIVGGCLILGATFISQRLEG